MIPPVNGLAYAVADRFPKKSILTPIGALAIIIFGTCVGGAIARWPSSLSWALLAVGIVPVFTAIWAYIYFALRDPDRLQTEDYRIQREYIARFIGNVEGDEVQLPRGNLNLVTRFAAEEGEDE
jgi:hypothetical protein